MSGTPSGGKPPAKSTPILREAAQALIACNQKLQELSINSTIKLPRIVVIGDQSTGKSSLIESISTIEVPKASGLCTKCPIAINLSGSQDPGVPWKCSVSVEERYSYNIKQNDINSHHPLGPWIQEAVMRRTTVASTQNRLELVQLIKRAQRLVLDPQRHNDQESITPDEKLETFSPNTIRLDIEATGWVNLSFVDLPGVIARAGPKLPSYSVKLVEALAKEYAKDTNNVILLTLPLNHDNANSRSFAIVEEVVAHTRTIAVFTKVDLASEEQRNACLSQYFNPNVKDEFHHGQHMVMLSDANEEEYFNTESWSTQSDNVQGKLGVAKLVDRIRNILFTETQRTLPQNLVSIETRLKTIEEELSSLPEPVDPANLRGDLRVQLMKFETNAKQLFDYGSGSFKILRTHMEDFETRVGKYEPTLRYSTNEDLREFQEAQEILRGVEESEVTDIEHDNPVNPPKPTSIKAYRFTLDEIQDLNTSLIQSNSSDEMEPKALDEMKKLCVQYWEAGLEKFIIKVKNLILKQVKDCIDETFKDQKHLPLYEEVQIAATGFLDGIITKGRQTLDHRCNAELTFPLTSDKVHLDQLTREALEEQHKSREDKRLLVATAVQRAENTSRSGPKRKHKPVDASSLGPDEYENEVIMFAKAVAYYRLAFRRFVDSCRQDILANFIRALQEGLKPDIVERLGLDNDNMARNEERIAMLMAENPKREADRRRLKQEEEKLIAGQKYITDIIDVLKTGNASVVDTHMSDDPFTATASTTLTGDAESMSMTPKRKSQATVEDCMDLDESPTKKSKKTTAASAHRSGPHSQLPNRARSASVDENGA